MAKSKKSNESPRTVITFEIDDEVRLNARLQRVNAVTVTARRSDLGYVAEVEMADLETDLLPIIEHVQRVFFNLTADGLPEFPDLKDQPEGQADLDTEAVSAETGEAVAPEEADADSLDAIQAGHPDDEGAPGDGVENPPMETYTVALYGPDDDYPQDDQGAYDQHVEGQEPASYPPDGDDDAQLSMWG